MLNARSSLIRILGAGFGAGMIPRLPGSCGTLIGGLLWWLMKDLPPLFYLALLAVLFPIGVWISTESEKIFQKKDAPQIVIDEILAFPLAMFLVTGNWKTLALAYLLFRFFDIVKPWPVRQFQRLPRGYGVMADDYAAALYACGTLHLILFWARALQT